MTERRKKQTDTTPQSGTTIASRTTNAQLPTPIDQKGPLTPTVLARPPSIPEKHTITNLEASRRTFLKGLLVIGGIIAAAPFIPVVDSYMRGSTEGA